MQNSKFKLLKLTLSLLLLQINIATAQEVNNKPKVLSFFYGKDDLAHVSFDHEANEWFSKLAVEKGFIYDTTSNWDLLDTAVLKNYQAVFFLDYRPNTAKQRAAFEYYMENGGSWLGFHFAAFALTPSKYPQDWDWYHIHFLGSGSYVSNTWRPTPAYLKVESRHRTTRRLDSVFISGANEWYRWERDLRNNPKIKILLSIHPESFPLGTGPKPSEIWHRGFYPVAWTNKDYRMVYINMGHNDMDYEGGTNKTLSHTFGHEMQDKFITQCVAWLLDLY
ncbi:hypothetical protein COR50_13040 [Chitinophaga caeni]|uniref:ThuA-like domain-containing protein n=1 Tax=Chitinophaga caeni TaxID=2029983 RepID=A0A291QVN0_9BACT|nr:ThuA domain-containing protein [Chitinophaga caeni]ATL48016.1 hypothetical protein COR50_13040 [Chitinophaga caeni]